MHLFLRIELFHIEFQRNLTILKFICLLEFKKWFVQIWVLLVLLFHLDTESGNDKIILINSSYGLGEIVVSGQIKPDEFIVHKDRLKNGYKAIIDKKLGNKTEKLIYSNKVVEELKIKLDKQKQLEFSLNDNQIIELSHIMCLEIEEYYTNMKGKKCLLM